MNDVRSETAQLSSDNSLKLAFPYHRANRGHLFVSIEKGERVKVAVVVERGQILCSSDCTIRLRIDGEEAVGVSGALPSDGSSVAVSLSGAEELLLLIKTARKIMIDLPMYQEGRQILEFSPSAPLRLALAPDPMGADRRKRLAQFEDVCRSRDEFIECLSRLRACFDTSDRTADSDAACTKIAVEFPMRGMPK